MKRVVRLLTVTSSFALSAFAMEFGTMGSHSFGMAGTGVAIKKSPWGLYYNPALIAADDAFKIGVYADVHSKNINALGAITKNFNPLNVNDVTKLYHFLRDTRLSFNSHSGAVFQLPDFGFGALSVGGFLHLVGNGSTKMDLQAFQPPNFPPKPPIGNVDDLGVEANFSVFSLIEVPVAYGYEFDTFLGELSVGVAVKYMKLFQTGLDLNIKHDQAFNPIQDASKIKFGEGVSSVGVDVGVAYEPIDLITLGFVGKNINAPHFDLRSQRIKIDPQLRAGIALNAGLLTLAFDADLTANRLLGTEIQNQMLSLGGTLDFGLLALRAGVAKDLKHHDDLIYALGIGFAFLDAGIQFGKKTSPFKGMKLPDYFALQVGAGFSF